MMILAQHQDKEDNMTNLDDDDNTTTTMKMTIICCPIWNLLLRMKSGKLEYVPRKGPIDVSKLKQ